MQRVQVQDVAKWFLSRESMTHKKLQKLCYYAQAWYCTLLNKGPLYDDEVQAWVHGPVIPALYPLYADFRWELIPKEETTPDFPEEVVEVLQSVYDTYSEFCGDQLEILTHNEDPWIHARGNLKPWEASTNVITCESMRKYYSEMYKNDQND